MSCHGDASVSAPSRGDTVLATRRDALRVLLVGGPNVGKSTLFNALTGARQHTTNAPGTTVELATGVWPVTRSGRLGSAAGAATGRVIVDLPGSYSLLARSADEQVTADAVRRLAQSCREPAGERGVGDQGVGERGVVVVVLDATTLARSLYLLGQVAETGVPLVVALTMLDLASSATDSPHAAMQPDTLAAVLGASLGVPVIPVDARSRATGGLPDLARAVDDVAARPRPVIGIASPSPCCGRGTQSKVPGRASTDCAAPDGAAADFAQDLAQNLAQDRGPDLAPDLAQDVAHAEVLFGWVERVVAQVSTSLAPRSDLEDPVSFDRQWHRRTFSDRVDTVLLNPWGGIPVFLGVV